MKAFTFVVSAILAVNLALGPASAAFGQGSSKKHELTAEVVMVDPTAKRITLKDQNGESRTLPVRGKAIAILKDLKPADKVTVTYVDNDKGEHEAVTVITKTPSTPQK